ncbi:putative ribonuclease H-like domain-containing protein [Tanacetum coccineum]
MGKPSYSRFTKTNDFKGVPPPLSGDYTPKPQEEIDDSLYVYGKKGPQKPEISVSDDNSSEHSTCQSNDSEGSCENTSEHSFETESESLSEPNEMSKSRQPLKDKETHKVNRKNWNDMMERELGEGYSFTKKKCFVCGCLKSLITRLCIYEKNNGKGKAEVKRVVNTVNHANKFVPRSVQLNTGRANINSVRPKVNAVSSNVNTVRSRQPEHPLKNMVDRGIFNSGCSGHMTHINHASYCLVITDDCTRFCWVFFLASKDETSGILQTFIRQIENQLSHSVKIIRSDNGTEFKNRDMLEFCGNKGIKQEYSTARTPQQNGVAERMNRTLIEAARTMLADSLLPTTFWAEAVSTACYIFNRVRVTKPQHKTPYELLFGHKPIISYIRPFGCHVTILDTLSVLGKFDRKSDEGFLVGYSLNSKAYRVYNLVTKRVEVNLHVNFLEEKPNVKGVGYRWMFDIDYLTDSMNYIPVSLENQANHAGISKETNSAGSSIASEEKDEEVEIIVVPSAVKIPEEKDESRTTSKNSKPEETLKDPQTEMKDSSTNPKIQAFRRELEEITLKHLGNVPENNTTSTNSLNIGSQLEKGFWKCLRIMFEEPLSTDSIWSELGQQKIISWRYYDTCRVHCLNLESMDVYMLSERKYTLSAELALESRRNLVLTDSEEEEPDAQGRKSEDDPLDSSVQGLITPPTTKVNTSGEEQVEEISPNTLEAAKTLSKVASLKSRSIDKGRRYKRRKETKGKKVVSSLDFQEEFDAGAEQLVLVVNKSVLVKIKDKEKEKLP